MIWHVFLKPLLHLVGNLFGYRPDIDGDQQDALSRGITYGLVFVIVPVGVGICIWALLQ